MSYVQRVRVALPCLACLACVESCGVLGFLRSSAALYIKYETVQIQDVLIQLVSIPRVISR